MAITDKEKGVWLLDEVYAKQNEGDIWSYDAAYEVYTWGRNSTGSLGLNQQGLPKSRSSPVQLPGTDWITPVINGGNEGNINGALKTGGALWMWGQNETGEMGQNSTNNGYSSPVRVGGASDGWAGGVIQGGQALMAKTDGTLWGWGGNSHGCFGLNNQTNYSSPKQVGTDTTWSGAAGNLTISGNTAVTAIKTDGTMWVWGRDDEGGEVGDANNVSRSSPVQVDGSWIDCARGRNHGVAVKSDGTLWTWGRNNSGQLGLSNNSHYSWPQKVGTDTDWSECGAGLSSTFGLKTNGELWSWGNGQNGVTGRNGTGNINYPLQIPGTNWAKICRGGNNCYGAIKTDGTLWVWGNDEYGQLGMNDGDIDRSSPTQVGTDTNWYQIRAGNNNFVALKQL